MGTYGAQYVCTLGKLCHEVLLNLLSDAGSNGRSGELAITKWSSEDPFRIIKVFLESFETNMKKFYPNMFALWLWERMANCASKYRYTHYLTPQGLCKEF